MKCIYDVITCGYLGVIYKTNIYFFIRHPNHTDLIVHAIDVWNNETNTFTIPSSPHSWLITRFLATQSKTASDASEAGTAYPSVLLNF
jgi:hypothetical protein